MDKKEILKNAGILENDEDNCYISEKNQIFTPLKDENWNMIKKGEEVYQNWLDNKNNPPKPIATPEQEIRAKLLKDNVNIQLQLAEQQKINANLLTQIAKLGGAK